MRNLGFSASLIPGRDSCGRRQAIELVSIDASMDRLEVAGASESLYRISLPISFQKWRDTDGQPQICLILSIYSQERRLNGPFHRTVDHLVLLLYIRQVSPLFPPDRRCFGR